MTPDRDAIRRCGPEDRDTIMRIVNAAAEAYRGIIPADRWREPYMPVEELDAEMTAEVAFWGYEAERGLVGVMGIQPVETRPIQTRTSGSDGYRPADAPAANWTGAR
jgi:hypothetical protein